MGTQLPFGLRDVKVAPISGAGVVGTMVDLPNAQTMSFSETEDYTDLDGDDKRVASVGNGPVVEWDLESGGINLAAFVIINGGLVTTTGVTPNIKNKYTKKSTDRKPNFWAEGQAISESGGDFHVTLKKCKATGNVEGSMTGGEFWVTSCSGTAIGDASDNLYDMTDNETAAAIVQPT
jgi:hypothetical protein